MRYLVSCFALVAASVLALSAIAQPPEKDGKKGDNKRAEMRERMLKEFDANKDGKLDDEERAKAREKMRDMRGARGGGKAGKGGPAGARGPEGRRGPQPPNPAEMFAKFDKDNDGKLSKDEFMEMAKTIREHMRRPGGPGGPDGARFEGRRPDGPDRHARFEGRRPPGPPMGPRFEGRDREDRGFAGGPEGRRYERDRFEGPPPRRGFDRERFAGPPEARLVRTRTLFAWSRWSALRTRPFRRSHAAANSNASDLTARRSRFERDRFAGPPRGHGMDRDRFAGPPERRDFDGPRPPRPPFEPRLADRRFDGPPRGPDFDGPRRGDRDEMGPPPASMVKKATVIGVQKVVPTMMARAATPKKVLVACGEMARHAATARRETATKAAGIADPTALRVVKARLRAMAPVANIAPSDRPPHPPGPGAEKPHPPGPPHEKAERKRRRQTDAAV